MCQAHSAADNDTDVAKSVVRRFADAMANHDHQGAGYDLLTFSTQASYIGTVNHRNLDQQWRNVRFGGGTRVMTGWYVFDDQRLPEAPDDTADLFSYFE